jgi:cysteinyl-tRNA synthetase
VDLSQVRQGERVADDEYEKEDVRDFVLWKGAKPDEPSWDSPWGPGRPGWHIECSAMGMRYLGETFDIHSGGVDNIFPHHENEIAQSESATGKEFVRHWLHAEHLIVDGEKMSKSLGNQYTLPELLERGYDPRAIRYLYLSVHYRKKLNFTFQSLTDAEGALRRIDEMWFRLANAKESEGTESALEEHVSRLEREFKAALADDLNTSAALGAMFLFVKQVNMAIEGGRLASGDRKRVREILGRLDRVLGVLDPEDWESGGDTGALSDDQIEDLVTQRTRAREERDFARADEIREQLTEAGIAVEDTPDGARWKRQ